MENRKVKRFWERFNLYHTINLDFYKLVPEGKFDDKMTEKSDSVRKSLAHQIAVENCYISAVENKKLDFGMIEPEVDKIKAKSKQDLTKLLLLADKDLDELCSLDLENITMKVPWSETPIPAIECLESLVDHEILHNGWNLALMDHLDIPRFKSLIDVWG